MHVLDGASHSHFGFQLALNWLTVTFRSALLAIAAVLITKEHTPLSVPYLQFEVL